jgi:hypothetical protein
MSDSKEGKVTGRKPPPNAGKGRPKGSLNKSTVAVKEALVQAFEGIGGVESLKLWAGENPTAFYQLWGKMLPLQVGGDPDGVPIKISRIELVALGEKEAE